MKRIYLLTICLLVVGAASAQTSLKDYMKGKPMKLQPLDRWAPKLTGAEQHLGIPANFEGQIRDDGAAEGSHVIGTTVYDLQTNSSVARRIKKYDDGSVTAVWTMAQLTDFTDRGTGYAHFDGTTWTYLNPTTALEPLKTGWPTLDVLNGKEFIISHDGTNYQMQQGFSDSIGLGDPTNWLFSLSGASVPVEGSGSTRGPIWPRMKVNGNSVHVVAAFQIGDSANIVNGVKAPFVYNRSTDGALTWENNIGLPNYDSTRTIYGGGDEYDIDGNEDGVLAILHGGLGEDVSLWKSTDDGATWVHTYVDSFEYAPDYALTAPLDSPLQTNDGSVSVVVDNNGIVHAAYAESVVLNDPTIGAAFQPGTIGLRYWTEGMDTALSVFLPVEAFDVNGDGEYVIGANTTEAGSSTIPGSRYRNSSILTHPSITYDTLGNIFIVFSMPRDLDTTFDGNTYRDVYVAAHNVNDDMETWTISNVTNTEFTEEAFGNAARMSDDKIRIEYMEDFDPGTNLNNGHPISTNNINYIEWQNPFITGINPISTVSGFSVNQNFPNPFSYQTQLEITLKNSADVNVKVTNLLGESILENNYTFSSGPHTMVFNRNGLASGVYYYTVKAGNESITNKMIIE